MSTRNRAAAKAAGIRKAKKAREHRREKVADEGVLERIRNRFDDEQLAFTAMIDEVDGTLESLQIECRLYMLPGAEGAEMRSRELQIRVSKDLDSDSVEVVAPFAWSLEEVSDGIRARIFENMLDAYRRVPVNLRYCDGQLFPSVRIALPADHLPEMVCEAVTSVLVFVKFFDASVRGVIETGVWVEPEPREMDDDTLRRLAEESAGRVEGEYDKRAEALWSRFTACLFGIRRQEGALEKITDALERLDSLGRVNRVFFAQGVPFRGVAAADLDELEEIVRGMEALIDEPEPESVTTE